MNITFLGATKTVTGSNFLLEGAGKKILVDVSLFDLYVDESIGLENKQLAYKLTFCDSEKTLESADFLNTVGASVGPGDVSPSDVSADEFINDFCASFQASVVDCIVNRLTNAMHDERVTAAQPKTLVVAGGVAKNSAIRSAMESLATKFNMTFAAPPMNLCTDNGAMIAWAGLENWRVGKIVTEPVAPRPRWPLIEL